MTYPSLLENREIDELGVPTQILTPETDPQRTLALKEYCNKVIPGLGIAYYYDYHLGLEHGCAVKGDPKNAQNAAVTWFNEHLHWKIENLGSK